MTKKWGEKSAKQFFQKHTNGSGKNDEKKSTQKREKKRFLYTHEYRDKKLGGKKRAKEFFQKHTNRAKIIVGKKSSQKSEKTIFYSQEYRDQEICGKKTRETIFPETNKWIDKKMLEKTTANMCEQTFLLYSHKHRYQKMGE